jgi:hypothetical protein
VVQLPAANEQILLGKFRQDTYKRYRNSIVFQAPTGLVAMISVIMPNDGYREGV